MLRSGSGTVVVVADRSASLPADATTRQQAAIRALQTRRRNNDNLGVVSFAARATLEHPPQHAPFSSFAAEHNPDASNLADAIRTALAAVPANENTRLLVLSDGRYTGTDPRLVAAAATAAGVAIDYRLLTRDTTSDLAIERLDVPPELRPGEALLATAWLLVPYEQQVSYTLRRGSTVIAQGEQTLPRGRVPLTFRDLPIGDSTVYGYTLDISIPADDPVPENNRARFLVSVADSKPLLCLTTSANSHLPAMLRAGGVDVVTARPEELDSRLESLAGYAGVVIENIRADTITASSQETIAAWVHHAGAGLLLTGGRNSFGIGGYYRSPLEAPLPVSMELRREHRKFSMAIVVALDRSGSMTMSVPGGRTKMELANIGTAEVVDLLSDQDEFAVLAVDTAPHTIIPLSPVSSVRHQKHRILSIESMGGGIYVYEALKAAAYQLSRTSAGVKHIVLFADAADSERPEDYKTLLAATTAAGITVSVIGLGTTADSDAALLEDIAERGGGRCFFTADALEVPRLFTQDTFMVARNTWITNAVQPLFTVGLATLSDTLPATAPNVGGYNLCYLKPDATAVALSSDENSAPILALGRYGSGRTAALTAEADGAAAGPFASWTAAPEFYGALARYCAGPQRNTHNNLLAQQQQLPGAVRINLYTTPDTPDPTKTEDVKINLLRHRPGTAPLAETIPLTWSTADSLSADIPLNGTDTLLATINWRDGSCETLPPVCLPYSPEHAPDTDNYGAALLADLARATRGKALADVSEIWQLIPRSRQPWPLAPLLYLAATLSLLLEIFERRTSWLTTRQHRQRTIAEKTPLPPKPRGRSRQLKNQTPPVNTATTPTPDAPPAESPLVRAKRRAAQRTVGKS